MLALDAFDAVSTVVFSLALVDPGGRPRFLVTPAEGIFAGARAVVGAV